MTGTFHAVHWALKCLPANAFMYLGLPSPSILGSTPLDLSFLFHAAFTTVSQIAARSWMPWRRPTEWEKPSCCWSLFWRSVQRSRTSKRTYETFSDCAWWKCTAKMQTLGMQCYFWSRSASGGHTASTYGTSSVWFCPKWGPSNGEHQMSCVSSWGWCVRLLLDNSSSVVLTPFSPCLPHL